MLPRYHQLLAWILVFIGAGPYALAYCTVGHFKVRNQCRPCPSGKYSIDVGPACRLCEKGKYNMGIAAIRCETCKAGLFATKPGTVRCVPPKTAAPTKTPTAVPTAVPTSNPTPSPTAKETATPTLSPTPPTPAPPTPYPTPFSNNEKECRAWDGECNKCLLSEANCWYCHFSGECSTSTGMTDSDPPSFICKEGAWAYETCKLPPSVAPTTAPTMSPTLSPTATPTVETLPPTPVPRLRRPTPPPTKKPTPSKEQVCAMHHGDCAGCLKATSPCWFCAFSRQCHYGTPEEAPAHLCKGSKWDFLKCTPAPTPAGFTYGFAKWEKNHHPLLTNMHLITDQDDYTSDVPSLRDVPVCPADTKCTPCPKGTANPDLVHGIESRGNDDYCRYVCPLGFYFHNKKVCHECSMGHYSPQTGSTSCKKCPKGKQSRGVSGAVMCV